MCENKYKRINDMFYGHPVPVNGRNYANQNESNQVVLHQ